MWTDVPLVATLDLEASTVIASETTQPLEGVSLRVLYLTEQVHCQLVGKDAPQVSKDQLEFMLSPLSMTGAEYAL